MPKDQNISQHYAAGFGLPISIIEERQERSLPHGIAKITTWQFADILMTHTLGDFKKPHSEELKTPEDSIILFFCIKGKTTLTSSNQTFTFANGEHNILCIQDAPTCTSHEFLQETFTIQMSIQTFRHFGEELLSVEIFIERSAAIQSAALLENNLHMDVSFYHCIREIISCSLTGTLRSSFIYARFIDLVVLQLASIQRANSNTAVVCRSDYDKERITFAREYLIQHMDLPPSLIQLSRIAGINEFKLKRGFKEMFNTTVFGYLAEHRLTLARHDIMAGKKSATEIAFELGYASPQHFSKAFKAKYGIPPKRFK